MIKGDLWFVVDCLMCVGIKYIYSCECYWFCGVVIERVYRVLIRVLEIYEKFNLIEGEFVV